MNREHFAEDLEEVIASGVPLRQVVSTLRDYQRSGISRDDVQHALESLRARTRDQAAEDRILEVLDIVSGFCSRDNTVWGD